MLEEDVIVGAGRAADAERGRPAQAADAAAGRRAGDGHVLRGDAAAGADGDAGGVSESDGASR